MPNNMELDRPHRPASSSSSSTTPSTSDLFICFTSRLSHSSSMRMSSKSILSPGRSDNKPPISLQTSLSRRMRSNNGSLRGQQSPMFPPKKRGCAFENPEPSSPKVTCIGQVRVKTKKHGKKMKMKMNMKAYTARRIQGGGNATEKQSWVQLPFSCLIPCKSSSCGSGEAEKQGKENSSSSSSTCGGAVYRWLVAFNGEGRTRDIELVVEEEEESVAMERDCSRRRSIFDDMDFNVEEICDGGREEKGSSRVSICVPPKNALLLMRCRSDPVKVSALANKFMESPPIKQDEEEEEEEEETEERRSCVREDEKIVSFSDFGGVMVREDEKIETFSNSVREEEAAAAERRSCVSEDEKIESLSSFGVVMVREDEKIETFSNSVREEEAAAAERRSCVREDEKIESLSCFGEVMVGEEDEERRSCVREDEKIESFVDEDDKQIEEEKGEELEQVEEMFDSIDSIEMDQERISVSISEDGFVNFAMLFEEEIDDDGGQSTVPPESTPSIEYQEEEDPDEIQQTVIGKESIFEEINQLPPLESKGEELEEEAEEQSRSAEQSPISSYEEKEEAAMEEPMLPDCLLLMMCEPKLSMEVSEETWVCSTDFLRPWLPERHRQHQLKKLNAAGEEPKPKNKKNRAKTESIHPLPPAAAARPLQPPRSSCSFPISMASLIEKKLVTAVAYEPFELTRCKSEPMRTASAKLGPAPEMACFWKNNKIEPHRPANCGYGAAGVGF